MPKEQEDQRLGVKPLDDAAVGYVLLRDYQYEPRRTAYARLVASRGEKSAPENATYPAVASSGW